MRTEKIELSGTKRKLLDAGARLMRANGFNATTVDDICSEAGVTKGAFFHYFENKESIAKAALIRFCDGKLQEFQVAPFRQLADPLERVHGRLDFVKESTGGPDHLTKGCLIGTFAQELSSAHPEFAAICADAFLRIARDFANDLAEAKAAYAPTAGFDPKSVAIFYVSIVQGSLTLAKAARNNAVLADNLEHFRRHLDHLFGRPRRTPVI